jgi:hypothetical protein
MILLVSVIATMLLLSIELQLPVKVTPSIAIIAYASANITGNNTSVDLPNPISTPPPLLTVPNRTVDVPNRTNIQIEQSVTKPLQPGPDANLGNDTNDTVGQTLAKNQMGQNTSNNATFMGPSLKPITKEQAQKAEQEASIMIKEYYEKLERDKQIEKEKEAIEAALASAQANQTRGATDTSDEELENATAEAEAEALINETEINGDDGEEENEGVENDSENDEE